MNKIKTIGILTSGGDSPGMNAAIRAVTRAGIYNGFSIKGIYRGYDGLIKDEVKTLTTEDVSGIINRGGTILKTARSKEFMTLEDYPKRYRHKKTIAGTPKNPIAIDTYENLYKCLDDEFFRFLGIYSWFKTGLLKVEISDLPYKYAIGLKYLIDYNEAQRLRII